MGIFLGSEVVTDLYREVFEKHNQEEQGSSKRFVRFTILPKLPQIDKNETTDKGVHQPGCGSIKLRGIS